MSYLPPHISKTVDIFILVPMYAFKKQSYDTNKTKQNIPSSSERLYNVFQVWATFHPVITGGMFGEGISLLFKPLSLVQACFVDFYDRDLDLDRNWKDLREDLWQPMSSGKPHRKNTVWNRDLYTVVMAPPLNFLFFSVNRLLVPSFKGCGLDNNPSFFSE